MRITSLLLLYFTLISTLVVAQDDHHHDHDIDHHEHHRNEISIANSAVYFLKEKEYAYGLHAHYVRNIHNSAFGFGVSYERVFDEHKHNTIGIVASYRPVNRFALSLSPGIAFEDTGSHASLALHIEATYEFPLGDFHIGPLVEFAMDNEDQHLSFGIHLGYGF
jgi:hypothetical protein